MNGPSGEDAGDDQASRRSWHWTGRPTPGRFWNVPLICTSTFGIVYAARPWTDVRHPLFCSQNSRGRAAKKNASRRVSEERVEHLGEVVHDLAVVEHLPPGAEAALQEQPVLQAGVDA